MSLVAASFFSVRPSALRSVRSAMQTSPYFTGLTWGMQRLSDGTYSQWDVRAGAVAYYGRPFPEAAEAIEGYLDARDDSEEMPEAAPGAMSGDELSAKQTYIDGLGAGIADVASSQWGGEDCARAGCDWCAGYNDAPAGDP